MRAEHIISLPGTCSSKPQSSANLKCPYTWSNLAGSRLATQLELTRVIDAATTVRGSFG